MRLCGRLHHFDLRHIVVGVCESVCVCVGVVAFFFLCPPSFRATAKCWAVAPMERRAPHLNYMA